MVWLITTSLKRTFSMTVSVMEKKEVWSRNDWSSCPNHAPVVVPASVTHSPLALAFMLDFDKKRIVW